jgi:hypothetical protein
LKREVEARIHPVNTHKTASDREPRQAIESPGAATEDEAAYEASVVTPEGAAVVDAYATAEGEASGEEEMVE